MSNEKKQLTIEDYRTNQCVVVLVDIDENCTEGDLAKIVDDCSNTKVIFDLPNETERQGFSKATKARLDGSKLKDLGWEMKYDMESGISRTLKILRENTK